MASPVRYFQKGSYYHVYNRGIRKENIFIDRKDYLRFIKRVKEYKKEFGITILSYCFMPNHFHFLLRQDTEAPLTKFMLGLSTSYAKYFNIKYEQVGSLFQDRFKAKLVDSDEYLLELSRYIHRNPLKVLPSTLGVELLSYYWSSYPIYISKEKNELVDTSIILNYFGKINSSKNYKNFVEYDFKEEDLTFIKDLIFEA